MTGKIVAFAGVAGAYSHLAARAVFGDVECLPCARFDLAFAAVEEGRADYAMIPIENSTAGRVADIHRLLPNTSLKMIGEHFQPVSHCLLIKKDTDLKDVKEVWSHPQALAQCEKHSIELNLTPHPHLDTAGAAQAVAAHDGNNAAAIASELAAEIYDLKIARKYFEDVSGNTTRFIIFAREGVVPEKSADCITSFIFKVRNVPAALYKAMGGFATNGVNMVKLESYMDQKFRSTMFYAEVAGHADEKSLQLALEELRFFSTDVKVLGTFMRSSARDAE